MKFTHLIAAGLAFATLSIGAAAPAEAQRDRGHSERYRDNDHRGDRGGFNRHDDRRGVRGRGHDRRNWNQRRCRTEWRHHRRVQICR